MARSPVLVALVLLAIPLAGCVSDAPPEATIEPTALEDAETNTTLPDGRTFAGAVETNKTESGLGGRVHQHDYWHGGTQVTVFDDEVSIFPFSPVFPSKDDTSHAGVAYIDLDKVPEAEDRPALVYEGTGAVIFTITQSPPWMQSATVSFRTAATDWNDGTSVKVGEPFVYEPTVQDLDVPHSERSLWNWQILSEAPAPVALATGSPAGDTLRVTIEVLKAREVVDWPGHPAFYAEVDKRVVMDNMAGKTQVAPQDVFVYGLESDKLVPEKLIGVGTGSLDVYVNITGLDPDLPVRGYTLWWRSADMPDYEGIAHNPGANDTEGNYAHWHLAVNETQLDAFYQPTSRFNFRVLAHVGDETVTSNVGRCYRCFPYTLEYTMTVVANKDPDYVPPVDDPASP